MSFPSLVCRWPVTVASPCRCREPGLAQGQCNCPTLAAVLFQFNKGVMRNKGVSVCLWAVLGSLLPARVQGSSTAGHRCGGAAPCQAQGAKHGSAIPAPEAGTLPCRGFWALPMPHPCPKGRAHVTRGDELCPQAVVSHSPHWLSVCRDRLCSRLDSHVGNESGEASAQPSPGLCAAALTAARSLHHCPSPAGKTCGSCSLTCCAAWLPHWL